MVAEVERRRQRLRRDALLLGGILLLATLLRIGWPRLTEFKFSEARLEALALELTREGRLPLIGVPSSAGFDHSPLSVYLYVPAFVATTSPIPATIYGGLAGVSAVALCWWMGRRLPGGGRWVATIASLLLATNPWAVAFSRKIWQITFVPLLSLAVVYLFLSALVGETRSAREGQAATVSGRRPWHLAWALAIYAVLLQVHPSAISLAPALLFWLAIFWRQVRPAPLLTGIVLGALTAVPFLIHQVESGWPLLHALQQLAEPARDLQALRLAWEAITGRGIQVLAGQAQPDLQLVPQLSRSFVLVGWLTLASALVLAWRAVAGWRPPGAGRRLIADEQRQQAVRADLLLLSWFIVPVLFNLQHSMDLHLHFFALILPAACLLAGRGLQALAAYLHPPVAGQAVMVGGSIVLGLVAIAQVLCLALLARFVATHATPGGFGTPLGVYLGAAERAVTAAGAGQVLVVGSGYTPAVDEVPAIFDVLLRDRVSYRFVDGQSAALFPAGPSVALLSPGAGKAVDWYEAWPGDTISGEYPEQYRLIYLDGTWPRSGLAEVHGPRLFQNGIELQGYRWTGKEVWLLWQALWQAPGDTHFSVRILDDVQQEWGRQDGVGYPSAQRRKGDRVLSAFDIKQSAPAVGEPVALQVGLYTFPGIVPVPVIDGAGNPIGDSVLLDVEN